MIHFVTEGVEMPAIERGKVEAWIRATAAGYGFATGDINYIFCSDERILEVNRQFLGHDYYTDIITFDYSTPTTVSGDIYISLDTVRSNAELFDATYDRELHRVIIHGLLHLTGQQDKTPETEAEMHRKEDRALSALKLRVDSSYLGEALNTKLKKEMSKHYLELLSETIRNYWDKPALTDYNGTANYTYGQMAEAIARLGALYDELGIAKGSHIAICGVNSSNWAVAYLTSAVWGGIFLRMISCAWSTTATPSS